MKLDCSAVETACAVTTRDSNAYDDAYELMGLLCRDKEMAGKLWLYGRVQSGSGATENAGVENAIRAKLQGWKMQE